MEQSEVNSTYTPVSGRACFWGLATLALNAMLQPSFVARIWSDDLFDETICPHKTSPFVCLVDALTDIWIIVKKLRARTHYRRNNEYTKPTTVVLRFVALGLGVLPQSVKIFGMRGIPITQTLAAIYLLNGLASFSRTLLVKDGYKDIEDVLLGPRPDGWLTIRR